jgi:hypothetical protein
MNIKKYDFTNKRDRCLWQIAWNKAHPHSCKNTTLQYKYGISLEAYQQLLWEQKFVCAICGKTPKQNGKSLGVDHCHKTNLVRGLLCITCNTILGQLKDNPKLLRKSLSYIC